MLFAVMIKSTGIKFYLFIELKEKLISLNIILDKAVQIIINVILKKGNAIVNKKIWIILNG